MVNFCLDKYSIAHFSTKGKHREGRFTSEQISATIRPMIIRLLRNGTRIIQRDGIAVFGLRIKQKVERLWRRKSKRKIKTLFLAKNSDILKADWSIHPYVPKHTLATPPFTINWVMSPPGNGSGGHQNIFRFIRYLEQSGHTCRVYLYSNHHFPTLREVEEVLSHSYPMTRAPIAWYKGKMEPADAIFATGWETAYPVFNDPSASRRFYFVQDFEPFFYPLGSEYIFAENTYRFNFFGITAGGWLASKLAKEYGMRCDYYDFGVEKELYRFENAGERKEIFFYARPVTTRRGFELGIMALERFHKQHPDYRITMAGWDVSEYAIPFPYINLKSLPLRSLSRVYNRSAAALVISLTNMSLLPLELLACGIIPVITDGENNRKVSNNPFLRYAHASPDALAQTLHDIVTTKDLPALAATASESVRATNWDDAGKKFVDILTKELHG